MHQRIPSTWRIAQVGLILGLLLNLLGWLGNVFVLGPLWNEALIYVHESPWRSTIWREIVTLVPDFIYGIVMVSLYTYLSTTQGPTLRTASKAAFVVFLVGVFTTYLGTANAGLLPWSISFYTTVLAFVTFVPGAWLMHHLLKGELHDHGDA